MENTIRRFYVHSRLQPFIHRFLIGVFGVAHVDRSLDLPF